MTDQEIARAFGLNLKKYLSLYDMKQNELAKRLGVGTSTVNNWVQGKKIPRMSKVDAMCKMFGCSRSDFIDEASEKLSADEYQCVKRYRRLSDDGKSLLKEYLNYLETKY